MPFELNHWNSEWFSINSYDSVIDFLGSLTSRVQIKVAFFQKSAIRFSNLPVFKKIFQITILSLKFKFPANNSKQQIQISSSG